MALAIAIASTVACGADDSSADAGTDTQVSLSSGISSAASGDGSGTTAGGVDDTTGGPAIGWYPRAALGLGARQETAVVALDGEIWVLGGFAAGDSIVDRVEAYDPVRDTWREATPLPQALHHANAAAVDGRLFVLGFLEGLTFDARGDVLIHEPGSDAWTMGSAMPASTERGAAGVAVLDTQVFVIGGLRQGQPVDDAWIYDAADDVWTPLPDLPTARDHLVAAAVDGIVYAIGGRDGTIGGHVPTVDVWDPAAAAWAEGPPMPTSRGGAAVAVVGGVVLVAGGEGNSDDDLGVFDDLEAFDPAAGTWTVLAPMEVPRHGTGAAAIGDTLYLPGGATMMAFGAADDHEAYGPLP